MRPGSGADALDPLSLVRRLGWADLLAAGAGLVMRGLDPELQLDSPHALEDALGHHPLSRKQVADHAEREELQRRDEENGAEDQRLHVAGAVAVEDPVDEERRPGAERQQPDDETGGEEDPQRL